MKIPWYVFKPIEEIARAVVVAVGAYAVVAVKADGFPTTQEGVIALLVGAIPIAIAAVRTFLNRTPLTPPAAPIVLDNPVMGAGGTLPPPQPSQ